MTIQRNLSIVLISAMLLGMFTACRGDVKPVTTDPQQAVTTPEPAPTPTLAPVQPVDKTALPRNETLYFAGLNWGPINGWNPFSPDMNNAIAIQQISPSQRITMFETLYMYNMLNGDIIPLLADGGYKWNDDMSEMVVKIKSAARWSDGTRITADDVAYTFDTYVKYSNPQGVAFQPFIESVTAVDESTILIKNVLIDGKPANPLMTLIYLVQPYVLQKKWLQDLEARNGFDGSKMMQDPGEDAVWSGPYTKYFADDTKVIMIRDDNYWGKDASMWGKLPVPKYLAHTLFADNNAGQVALAAGEVDVCQQFIANVQDMWLKDGLPISTYIDEPPYGICVNMPTAWYNLSSYGLDNVAVRKAIALAVDYDAIIANAMTNQSPTFSQVPRSLMNPTAGEQAMYDHDAVKHLQWAGNDIQAANKLLDDAGILKNADGWRELNGRKLEYNACCPNGWTDWMAAMEIVAAAGKEIGIDITTNFPEWDVYQTIFTASEQSEYDIFMVWTDSATPAMPWARVRMIMSSEYNGVESNWSGNWGHYENPRVDELLKLIPLESDPAKLKEYYTECVEIYLTDVPSFSLMYRPDQFHVVNESVWTGFTEEGDGNNIPPMHCTDGYGIADLYNLRLVN